MDSDLKKRNTDCVYFLASPLTCKKGPDCEYRHSDNARLNPRDCWYWVSGNCLNPNCPFRHPPLEAHSEQSAESASARPTSQNHAALTSKTNTPCFFYFNAYCNKGDQCLYLHGPDASNTSIKPPRASVTPVPATPAATNKPPTPINSLPCRPIDNKATKPTGSPLNNTLQKPTEQPADIQPVKPVGQPMGQPMNDKHKESAAIRAGISQNEFSLVSADQTDNHNETEWRESSPGFDVLVDNQLDMDEEDTDQDYIELERPPEQYDCHDQIEYDPLISSYEEDAYLHNREFSLSPLAENGHTTVDLRDHLRKRRRMDNHQRGSLASHQNGFSHMKSGEMASRFLHSEISRKAPVRERISVPGSASFSGPKTLDQIKEEKRRAVENGSARMNTGWDSPVDFVGPKRLCEILKQKKGVVLDEENEN